MADITLHFEDYQSGLPVGEISVSPSISLGELKGVLISELHKSRLLPPDSLNALVPQLFTQWWVKADKTGCPLHAEISSSIEHRSLTDCGISDGSTILLKCVWNTNQALATVLKVSLAQHQEVLAQLSRLATQYEALHATVASQAGVIAALKHLIPKDIPNDGPTTPATGTVASTRYGASRTNTLADAAVEKKLESEIKHKRKEESPHDANIATWKATEFGSSLATPFGDTAFALATALNKACMAKPNSEVRINVLPAAKPDAKEPAAEIAKADTSAVGHGRASSAVSVSTNSTAPSSLGSKPVAAFSSVAQAPAPNAFLKAATGPTTSGFANTGNGFGATKPPAGGEMKVGQKEEIKKESTSTGWPSAKADTKATISSGAPIGSANGFFKTAAVATTDAKTDAKTDAVTGAGDGAAAKPDFPAAFGAGFSSAAPNAFGTKVPAVGAAFGAKASEAAKPDAKEPAAAEGVPKADSKASSPAPEDKPLPGTAPFGSFVKSTTTAAPGFSAAVTQDKKAEAEKADPKPLAVAAGFVKPSAPTGTAFQVADTPKPATGFAPTAGFAKVPGYSTNTSQGAASAPAITPFATSAPGGATAAFSPVTNAFAKPAVTTNTFAKPNAFANTNTNTTSNGGSSQPTAPSAFGNANTNTTASSFQNANTFNSAFSQANASAIGNNNNQGGNNGGSNGGHSAFAAAGKSSVFGSSAGNTSAFSGNVGATSPWGTNTNGNGNNGDDDGNQQGNQQQGNHRKGFGSVGGGSAFGKAANTASAFAAQQNQQQFKSAF